VLRYLGRYTHRVAISNHRLLDLEDGQVRFLWKDYREDNRQKTMTLPAEEFIRRFLLHVLPAGFQRIRYYGLLGNRCREQKLALCRQLLPTPQAATTEVCPDYRDVSQPVTGNARWDCPLCHQGRLRVVETLPRIARRPALTDTS